MRSAPKFGPSQKALQKIRYSLLLFAKESGTSAATEVNRQMLQELVDAGCDQVGTGPRGCLWAGPGMAHLGYRGALQMSLERGVWATSPLLLKTVL